MELIIPIKINLKNTALMSEIFYFNNLDSRIRSAYICATALRPSLINLKTFLPTELLKKITLTVFLSAICVYLSHVQGVNFTCQTFITFGSRNFNPKVM